jgi:hypothetical protein
MLLLLYTSSTLVRLRSLQSRDERVGQRSWLPLNGRRQPVQGHVEAQL